MSRPLRKIDVDGLRVGMFVSCLDRPWLETPFLFQGFFIRNDNEIEDLRRYCDFVQIDIEVSDARILDSLSPVAPKSRRRAASTLVRDHRNSIWHRISRVFGRKKEVAPQELAPGEFYQDTASTADELVVAKNVHSGALDQLMNVFGIASAESLAGKKR